MTAHLLQLAIGPVQEFIAAARRTRDLWFGSHLLSEISRAAARAVEAHGGNLIFPASADAENVANIIVAELHNRDPEPVARSAKEAAQHAWRRFADPVFEQYERIIRREIWDRQIDDVVEFYAVWVPFTPEAYSQARKRLARLMAGRKNCRDFLIAPRWEGVPKSSLDGLRETVLRDEEHKKWPPRERHSLRVRPGEQLDVVGLVKRHGLGKRSYPSVSRIAADPWVRGIAATQQGQQALNDLVQECESLGDLLHEINLDRLHSDYGFFRYEGTALYRSRHHEIWEENGEPRECIANLSRALSRVEAVAAKANLGAEPNPYLAVLVADGDRMGDAISKLGSPEAHKEFSSQLASFAGEAERIVKEHHGVLVYSGGDDVLAFLPLDRCLACARQLHTAFGEIMQHAVAGQPIPPPTLSVGLGIGHFLENLEDLRQIGLEAEKDAKKPDRDGLAVHLHKRGGSPIRVRCQWDDALDLRLIEYAWWFVRRWVSSRLPYELQRLADLYQGWTDPQAIQRDAIRIIEKKQPGGGDSSRTISEQIRNAVTSRVASAKDLRRLAEELLIGRQLAVALKQSGRTGGPRE